MNHIDARLQEIARDVFRNNSLVLTDSSRPGEVSGWDSLGHTNFMLSVEDEFGVELSEEEFVRFVDIGELKQILTEKLVNCGVLDTVSGEHESTAALSAEEDSRENSDRERLGQGRPGADEGAGLLI